MYELKRIGREVTPSRPASSVSPYRVVEISRGHGVVLRRDRLGSAETRRPWRKKEDPLSDREDINIRQRQPDIQCRPVPKPPGMR